MLTYLRNFLVGQPGLFAFLRRLTNSNFRAEKEIVNQVFEMNTPKRVLDIGSGTGEFADMFVQWDYTGIDISPEYVTYAQKHCPGNFQVMDATNLALADNSFDAALIVAILHHLDDKQAHQLLSEAHRVVRSGGMVLVMEHAHVESLDTLVSRLIRRYDKGDFIRIPEAYRALVGEYFTVANDQSFKNGGCVYHCLVLRK